MKAEIIPSADGRYYYKAKSGKGLLNLKGPLNEAEAVNYIQITPEEFAELTPQPAAPSAAQIAARNKKRAIAAKKAELAATDYVVIKIAESEDPEEIAALREEYAAVIAHRKQLRAEINALEEE